MISFRFGFWVGLIAGLVLTFLWNTEEEWDEEILVPVPDTPVAEPA
ncbi:MAG: hypothetical protein GXP37_11635 [Chloroflexi bacterium]|nr:hypothetical protein [Chloroflexota bacterium]